MLYAPVGKGLFVNTDTKYYVIYPEDWKLADSPPSQQFPNEDSDYTYRYYEFSDPTLTNAIFNSGMMNAYLTSNGNRKKISPLPYDGFYIDRDDFAWTEHLTCEFSPGRIKFILRYNDFNMVLPEKEYTFMVRFMW